MNETLEKIFGEYKNYNQVKAIAIGGSLAGKSSDEYSDIDVYVFVNKEISLEDRQKFIPKYSSKYEIGGEYFGSGDEFYLDKINKQLDVMYWHTDWFEGIVNNVWIKHYPSNGYTTAFLFTLKNFEIIFDTNDWLKNLQNIINTEYSTELKQNIIKRNTMLLKDKPFASYYEQIAKGIKRNDIVSINHRIAAFLASYFDIIFAVNGILHPGEKRLIKYAKENCKILPEDFETNIEKLLIQPNADTLKILDDMIEKLKLSCKYWK